MLKKLAVIALALMVCSNTINALFSSSPTKEHCSQKLVELLETNCDHSKVKELFAQCIKHGSPEQQIKAATVLAQTLKKSGIEEKGFQTLHEINLEQHSQTTNVKQDGWRWYHYFGCIWACLGICVTVENEIDNYYARQPRNVEEQSEEEKAEAAKKKKTQQKQKRLVEV